MAFDYSLLDGKITEKYKNRYLFAQAMELSDRSLSLKMNNKVPWTAPQIEKAVRLLGIKEREIPAYFFKEKVQQN